MAEAEESDRWTWAVAVIGIVALEWKDLYSPLESIMHEAELPSIILSKVPLTDRTGYLLLFQPNEGSSAARL